MQANHMTNLLGKYRAIKMVVMVCHLIAEL